MTMDLAGKVLLVTGGTEGIGRAAVRDFAKRGATLTLVGRNPEKTARVVAELKAETGNERIDSLIADMSRLADVRRAAAQFIATHDRLDVLVNNAGAVFKDYRPSPDGYELTFALNHLGYFQLTVELLELLRRTPGARVVSTSSGAHLAGRMDLDTIAQRQVGGWRAYADSKLANVLFTRELARRLAGTTAVANCFHPGFIRSGFGMNNDGFFKSMIGIGAALFARTPERGADTLVWLATSAEAAGFNGQYFQNRKPARCSSLARNDALAARLWALSEKLCASA